MPIVGRLIGLKVDARWLIAAGLLIMTAGNYWMSQLNLDISPGQAVWPRVLVVVGLSVCFAPLKRRRLPLHAARVAWGGHWLVESPAQRGGQRRGVAVPDIRRAARAVSRVEAWGVLDPFNPAVTSFLSQAQATFLKQTGDPVAAQQLAWQALENLRQQQAGSLAYFDTFWMAAVLTFVVAFAVFFMKRSVAEKGAHVGSE